MCREVMKQNLWNDIYWLVSLSLYKISTMGYALFKYIDIYDESLSLL